MAERRELRAESLGMVDVKTKVAGRWPTFKKGFVCCGLGNVSLA